MDFTVEDIVSDWWNIIINCTPESGTLFSSGSEVVTCKATDEAGNESGDGCQFTVVVIGNKQKNNALTNQLLRHTVFGQN